MVCAASAESIDASAVQNDWRLFSAFLWPRVMRASIQRELRASCCLNVHARAFIGA
jgi:hypothetical protein